MVQGRDPLGAALLPSSEDVQAAWPVFGSAALMLALYLGRKWTSDDSDASSLNWGAYEKQRTLKGEWWRVATYSFVYEDWAALVSDIAALTFYGSALTRRQGPSVAFATLRLGLLVSLLSVVFDTPEHTVVTSLSGPAYSMLGALLMDIARGDAAWGQAAGSERCAMGAGALTTLALGARLLFASPKARRAQLCALAAGAVATNLAALVAYVENRQDNAARHR